MIRFFGRMKKTPVLFMNEIVSDFFDKQG